MEHVDIPVLFLTGVLYQLENKSTSAEPVLLVITKNYTISTIIYSDPMTNK